MILINVPYDIIDLNIRKIYTKLYTLFLGGSKMKAKFIISGMSCGHCVKRVDNALKDLEGVTSAEVTVGEAIVEGTASIEAIKEAIDDAGYDVEKVEEI